MLGASGQRRRWSLLAAIAVVATALCVGLLAVHAGGRAPTLTLRSVGTFDAPIYVAHAPGAPGFLYVVEQGGTVEVVDHGTVRAQPFLDIRQRVLSGGEQGLLSIAFDPSYGSNHLLYAAYTRDDGALEVDEFHASSNVSANKFSRRKVIVV